MAAGQVRFVLNSVQGVSDAQSTAHGNFTDILGQVKSTVNTMLGSWTGDGTEEYKAKQTEFDTKYDELQAAFLSLQQQTDEAIVHFGTASNKLKNTWT